MGSFWAAAFFLLLTSASAAPTPLVGSREYKVILDETKFKGPVPPVGSSSSTVQTAVRNYWTALKATISCCSETSASSAFDLRKSRIVQFYDVPSTQGSTKSCWLNKNTYNYRQRQDEDATTGTGTGGKDVTLKTRASDRYIPANENNVASTSGSDSKFEEDVSPPFVSKFSQSITVPYGSGKTLNEIADISDEYAWFKSQYVTASGSVLTSTTPLAVVSGLTIIERVFEDPILLVGSSSAVATFSLTIWYPSTANRSDPNLVPLLVESSFRIEKADETYGRDTVRNSLAVFNAMQALTSWNSADSSTKSNVAYSYSPGWCI